MAFTILLTCVTISGRGCAETFCALPGSGARSTLIMRLLLLSDIHANLEAFEACMAAAPEYDRVVNLGDVVGYNASPNEICERVSALKEFNPVAALSAYWTKNALSPDNLEWLRALPQGPLRHKDFPGMEFVHGSPLDEDEYLLNTAAADDNLS